MADFIVGIFVGIESWLDITERGDTLPFTPAQKHGGGASIRGAGVAVADIDGEEVAEAGGGPLPAPAISFGSCAGTREGTS
jgi:hypothetical protein